MTLFADVTSRYSMRSLRSSLASTSLGPTSARAVRQAESVTAYTAVPRQRLNLVELQVRMMDLFLGCG